MEFILKQPEIQAIISGKAPIEQANLSPLAENAWLWRIQYQVQKAHLIASSRCTAPNKTQVLKTAETTLFLAKLLEKLYGSLHEANLQTEYNQDIILLQKLLNQPAASSIKANFAFPEFVQKFTYHTDTTRLIAGHTRRIGLSVFAFPEIFGPYKDLEWFSAALAPIFTWLGFLIYLPRTLISSFLLTQYAYEKQDIDLNARFFAHAEIGNRLFNIINDLPTVAGGFVAVFLLTASTLYLAVYITLAVKFCEVVLAAAKAYIDVSRLNTLRAQYLKYHEENPTEDSKAHLDTLDAYIKHEAHEQYVLFGMHALLLFCLAAFVPVIMLTTPIIPIFAAVFAIALVCLRFPSVRGVFLPEPVESNLEALSTQGFFAEKPTQGLTETPPESTFQTALNT